MKAKDISSILKGYVQTQPDSIRIVDANEYLPTGIYHVHKETRNLPTDVDPSAFQGSSLIHCRFNGEAIEQLLLSRAGKCFYYRVLMGMHPNQYWEEWKKIAFTTNIPTDEHIIELIQEQLKTLE